MLPLRACGSKHNYLWCTILRSGQIVIRELWSFVVYIYKLLLSTSRNFLFVIILLRCLYFERTKFHSFNIDGKNEFCFISFVFQIQSTFPESIESFKHARATEEYNSLRKVEENIFGFCVGISIISQVEPLHLIQLWKVCILRDMRNNVKYGVEL